MASMTTAQPTALSVAPLPPCHESRCVPPLRLHLFSSARNLPNHIRCERFFVKCCFKEDFELRLNALLSQAPDSIKVLRTHLDSNKGQLACPIPATLRIRRRYSSGSGVYPFGSTAIAPSRFRKSFSASVNRLKLIVIIP